MAEFEEKLNQILSSGKLSLRRGRDTGRPA